MGDDPQNPEGKDNQGPLVLIVEDDPSLAKMYSMKFKADGFNVAIAYNGATGLEKAAKDNPSLILLDMMLPKFSGIEFLEQIRQHGQVSQTPIVALTNLTEKKDADRAYQLGVKEYLVKAMHTPEEVVQIVKKHLQPTPQPAVN